MTYLFFLHKDDATVTAQRYVRVAINSERFDSLGNLVWMILRCCDARLLATVLPRTHAAKCMLADYYITLQSKPVGFAILSGYVTLHNKPFGFAS